MNSNYLPKIIVNDIEKYYINHNGEIINIENNNLVGYFDKKGQIYNSNGKLQGCIEKTEYYLLGNSSTKGVVSKEGNDLVLYDNSNKEAYRITYIDTFFNIIENISISNATHDIQPNFEEPNQDDICKGSKIKKTILILKPAIILLLFFIGGLMLIYPIIAANKLSEYWWYLLLIIATCISVSTTGTKGSYLKRYLFFALISIVLVSIEVFLYKTGFIHSTIERILVSIITSIMFAGCLVVPTVLGAAINNMILKIRKNLW